MANAAFWDRRADSYFRRPIDDMAAYEATLDAVRQHLLPTDRLLEVGCGTGGTAIRLAPAVASVLATDLSGAMLDHAATREAPANVTFRRAPAEAELPEAPFDAICAFSLFHLVDDMEGLMRHLRSQLRPGGLLFSKTICLGEMSRLFRPILPAMRLVGLAPKVRFLTGPEISAALERSGFAVRDWQRFGQTERVWFFRAEAV